MMSTQRIKVFQEWEHHSAYLQSSHVCDSPPSKISTVHFSGSFSPELGSEKLIRVPDLWRQRHGMQDRKWKCWMWELPKYMVGCYHPWLFAARFISHSCIIRLFISQMRKAGPQEQRSQPQSLDKLWKLTGIASLFHSLGKHLVSQIF